MSSSYVASSDTARKTKSALLRGLASVGQANVATALGVSETMVSRWKSDGEIDRIAALLDLLELKATPVSHRCYPPEYVDWLVLGNNIAGRMVRSVEDVPEEDIE
jgi:transcriptional regulator with XRE-family HTH domain